jgi:hypothetical protein
MEIRNSPLAKKIDADIRKEYESGKLKDKKLKDFMKNYYDGDPSTDCPNGCKGNCLLDCYIDIHQSLIGDDGKQRKFQTDYIRDGERFCCGKQLVNLKDNLYCTVCGTEY